MVMVYLQKSGRQAASALPQALSGNERIVISKL
jgi:hypothetical protein